MLVAACTPDVPATPRPTDRPGTESVTLTVNAKQQAQQVLVSGTTNLPDGALLEYRLSTAVGTTPAKDAPGTATVSGGAYSVSVDVSGWPNGSMDVWVAFKCDSTEGQPDAIVAQYGTLCSRVAGPNVTIAASVRSVQERTTVQLTGL
jgi:hypothetical protein